VGGVSVTGGGRFGSEAPLFLKILFAMDSIELRKFAIEVAQTTTNDGVELMNTANKVLEFLENGSQERDVLCILIFPDKKA
jgi:hypothetical protein